MQERWKSAYIGGYYEEEGRPPDFADLSPQEALHRIHSILDANVDKPNGWYLADVSPNCVHFHMESNGRDWCWTFTKVI